MANSMTSNRLSSQLKTPKGTRDLAGQELLLRDRIIKTITDVFQLYGGVPLDTPVFELRNILSEKYGEDERLIYNLEDQGGEICSLRYDLTVPFARWLGLRTDVKQIKRYQIGKGYRRDQPAISRGRLREFYQCDFDIAGIYDTMIPDAEILRIITVVFQKLDMDVTIKVNNRLILDGLFAICGVPDDLIRTISSSIDKMDKMPWAEVKREMVEDKGLAEDIADRIGVYVQRKGSMPDMLELLQTEEISAPNESLRRGISEMKLLVDYLRALDALGQISFDLSLARGLDYYTGVIYEVVCSEGLSQVGSLAAGGRYDNLVAMYSKQPLPCTGVSFGADRIFTILNERQMVSKSENLLRIPDVYIVVAGGKDSDGLILQRMAIARELLDAGIQAEYMAKVKPRLQAQFNACQNVPIVVLIGPDELERRQVRIKARNGNTEDDKGRLIARISLVDEVVSLLQMIR